VVAAITGLVRAESVVVSALNENFKRHGITPAGFNVLMILDGSEEPLCPNEIGARRLVTRGTVTGVVDSLEERGLVARRRHPDDRRSLLIELTAKGRRLLKDLLPDHRAAELRVLGSLSDREVATLAKLLAKVGPE
jgi:DNA-binding MarR family transcriptional regulator